MSIESCLKTCLKIERMIYFSSQLQLVCRSWERLIGCRTLSKGKNCGRFYSHAYTMRIDRIVNRNAVAKSPVEQK